MYEYLKNIEYPKKICNDDDIIAEILKYSSIGFISYQLVTFVMESSNFSIKRLIGILFS